MSTAGRTQAQVLPQEHHSSTSRNRRSANSIVTSPGNKSAALSTKDTDMKDDLPPPYSPYPEENGKSSLLLSPGGPMEPDPTPGPQPGPSLPRPESPSDQQFIRDGPHSPFPPGPGPDKPQAPRKEDPTKVEETGMEELRGDELDIDRFGCTPQQWAMEDITLGPWCEMLVCY